MSSARQPRTVAAVEPLPQSGEKSYASLAVDDSDAQFRAELRAAAPRMTGSTYGGSSGGGGGSFLMDGTVAPPPAFPTFPSSSASASASRAMSGRAGGAAASKGLQRPSTMGAGGGTADDRKNETFAELRQRKNEELKVYLEGREASVGGAVQLLNPVDP
jgi:hypothetical protein